MLFGKSEEVQYSHRTGDGAMKIFGSEHEPRNARKSTT